jgi:hypothetical protein
MATIDEELAEFMKGWHIGAMPPENGDGLVEHYKPKGTWTAAMQRGFTAARIECNSVERDERDRLVWRERYGEGSLTAEESALAVAGETVKAVRAYRLRTNAPLRTALDVVRIWGARK